MLDYTTILLFGCLLLVAVLLSQLTERSILSASVLFLVAGFFSGEGMLGLVVMDAEQQMLSTLADLTLFTVLFTDGMRLGVKDLTSAWRLPGRALFFGMPLTLLCTGLFAHYAAGLGWLEAFLVGAVLSPTDPVFASAIVGREEIPYRLRHLLNVESGLNDGLALPLVVALLAHLGPEPFHWLSMMEEVALGIVLGFLVPWLAIHIEQSRYFSVAKPYEPLFAVSTGIILFSLTGVVHANSYLAAFTAGITLATMRSDLRDEFKAFGGLVGELLKLATLLLFGALISPRFLREIGGSGYAFALLALFLARPAALGLAMLGSNLEFCEKAAAAWFGPKGFASVVYGIMILHSGAARADYLFHLIALVIIGSIIAHSSTDVPVVRWFQQAKQKETAVQN